MDACGVRAILPRPEGQGLPRIPINNAAKATMLAHAEASDLDNLAALVGVERLPDELDDRLRHRAQLALESYSTAGPTKSYLYHALSASNTVKDAWVDSPTPGTVRVVVLAVPSDENPGGVPGLLLQDVVQAACSAEDVRPLTDTVLTVPAEVITYSVQAALTCLPGVGAAAVVEAAQAATEAYVAEQFALGYDITASGLYQALRQPGVARVTLISPPLPVSDDPEEQDIVIAVANDQAARCTGVAVTLGGVGA
jgi:phage-related baseplate assembly protein